MMRDVFGCRIVDYKTALKLKRLGFNWECTGYYHFYGDEDEELTDDERYECVGWVPPFRNSYSDYRAAAPTLLKAWIWMFGWKIKHLLIK